MLIEEIDGAPSSTHVLAPFLAEAGFTSGAMGMRAVGSRSVVSRQSIPQSRRSQSSVSSPFARRYFDRETDDSD
jgi:hypothetical protein